MMKYSKKRIQKMVVDKIRSTEQPLTLVQLSKELRVQRINLQPVVRAMVEDGTIEMVKPGGDLAPTFSLPESSRVHQEDSKAVNPEQDHGLSDIVLTESLSIEETVTLTAKGITESQLETDPVSVDEPLLQTDHEPAQHDTSNSTAKIVAEEHTSEAGISDLHETESLPVFRTWFSKTKAVRSYPLINVSDIKRIINGRYKGESYLPTFIPVGEIGFWISVDQYLMSSGWFPFFIPGALLLIDANKRYVDKDGVYLVFYTHLSDYVIKSLNEYQSVEQAASHMTVIGRIVDVRLTNLI